MENKEKRELKKKIDELKEMKGEGTELISLYIPPNYNVNQEVSRLRTEYSEAANIKSKSTRKHVQAAIKTILQTLKGTNKAPENGIAVFAGHIDGDVKRYIIKPPEPLKVNLYNCDSEFYLEPLEELVESKEVYGLVAIDGKDATIARLNGKNITIIQRFSSKVPSKHTKGGWSQRRFERLIDEAKNEYHKKVASVINKEFDDEKIRGVIFGGPGQSKDKLLSGDHLNHNIKEKVIGKVNTGYADETGIKELMEKSEDLISGLEVQKEIKTIEKFMKNIVTSGLSTYGLEQVVKALRRGKVEKVLISDDIDWVKAKVKCPGCGQEETEVIKDKKEFKEEEEECSECGEERKIVEETPIEEELEKLAEETGAEVEYISTDTDKGKQFYNAFGGIGAILRYK